MFALQTIISFSLISGVLNVKFFLYFLKALEVLVKF